MKRNMGSADRVIRVLIAAIVGILYFQGTITGVLATVLLLLSGIFLLTSLINFCPIYSMLGMSTRPVKKKKKS